MHAIPLWLRGQTIGAMNPFHCTPGALTDADLSLGQALADVATIGSLSERPAKITAEGRPPVGDANVGIVPGEGGPAVHTWRSTSRFALRSSWVIGE